MRKTRIMIVEDESIVASDIQNTLESLGYQVPAVAASGEEAIRQAGELRPDLVLMDIKLKGEMDGTEAADQIRHQFDLPVIYLTAYADKETLARAKITEPFGFIIKPYEDRELHSSVEMALYKHRMESRLREREARLSTIFESAMDGLFVIDMLGRFVDVNPAGCRMFGFTREQILGADIRLLLFPEDVERTFAGGQRRWREGGYIPEYRLRHQNNTEVWVEMTVAPLKLPGRDLALGIKRDITRRKKLEVQLRESEEYWRSLVTSMDDRVFILNARGRISGIYGRWMEQFQFTPDQFLGKSIREVFGPQQAETHEMAFAKAMQGETVSYEWSQCPIEPGATQFYLNTSSPLRDAGGTITGVVMVGRDISQLKQTEAQLREQERFLTLLNAITHAALETTSLRATLQTLADRLGELFGADGAFLTLWDEASQLPVPAAAYGPVRESYPQDRVVAGEVTATESVLRAGRPLTLEDVSNSPYLSRRIAEKYPARSMLALPLAAGGRWLGAALIAFDQPRRFAPQDVERGEHVAGQISLAVHQALLRQELEERVQARTAEAHTEKEKSEVILENIQDAILLADREMRITYINPAWTRLTGYELHEVLGQYAGGLGAAADDTQTHQMIRAALVEGRPWQGEVEGFHKSGRGYHAILSIAPIRGKGGQTEAYVCSHHDISPRKKLDLAREQFITSVSHELRTPVTNLKLYAQLLERGLSSDKAQQYVQVLSQQADRLGSMVQDILEMATLDSDRAIQRWEELEVPILLTGSLNRVKSRAAAARVQFTIAPLPPKLPRAKGDPARIAQALAAILENAVTFAPDSTVTIEASSATSGGRQWLTIAVTDAGPGIKPEEQERVFDRFYRGSLAELGHVPGSGLGLSIAQTIMATHGGKITLDSQPGRGSTFTLWLPAAPDTGPLPF